MHLGFLTLTEMPVRCAEGLLCDHHPIHPWKLAQRFKNADGSISRVLRFICLGGESIWISRRTHGKQTDTHLCGLRSLTAFLQDFSFFQELPVQSPQLTLLRPQGVRVYHFLLGSPSASPRKSCSTVTRRWQAGLKTGLVLGGHGREISPHWGGEEGSHACAESTGPENSTPVQPSPFLHQQPWQAA